MGTCIAQAGPLADVAANGAPRLIATLLYGAGLISAETAYPYREVKNASTASFLAAESSLL
jgi:hypothetical protein